MATKLLNRGVWLQLARFNAALGTAGSLKEQLQDDCLTLETKITSTLKACTRDLVS